MGWKADIATCYGASMPNYEPLEIAGGVDCLEVDLLSFDWTDATARFRLPDDRVLSLRFSGQVIVRMLDEFALSTEDSPSERNGLVGHHFAYRVADDPFLDTQSKVWREDAIVGPLRHYRFITGGGCLDVLSHGDPEIHIGLATSAQD